MPGVAFNPVPYWYFTVSEGLSHVVKITLFLCIAHKYGSCTVSQQIIIGP